jgi:hypothetical protein
VDVTHDPSALRFVEPAAAQIGGRGCDGMNVRAGSAGLGRLKGFVVDPAAGRVCYLVVNMPGLLGRTRLVPAEGAHVDQVERIIDVPEDIARERPTGPEPFADDDFVAAILSDRSVA